MGTHQTPDKMSRTTQALSALAALAANDGSLWLDLMMNNKYQSSAFAHVVNDWAGASQVVVLTLDKGDQVWVQSHGTSALYGDVQEVYATFSGYLMYHKPGQAQGPSP